MGGSSNSPTTTTTTKLKRENFRHTKHDTAFSKWKILIGPSDWADYEARKEGAERYRVGNLPQVCGPGLYEIGVAVCLSDSGRDVGKLDTERIVVVYLGQADNVKSRLQEYGRCGSHLVNGFGLFKDVFSRGYPIVYRWAHMKSKRDAERTETELLERFDYAWNKVGNGDRRPNDILNKIEKISSQNNNTPKIKKMLRFLISETKVGVPINAEKLSFGDKPSHDTYDNNVSLFDRVFKFSRSQPRLVPTNPEPIIDHFSRNQTCGVISSDGTICIYPPVKGRKRCSEHKGMKINQTMPKSSILNSVIREPISTSLDPAEHCGVNLGDGNRCEKQPVKGRKRCEQHKGMRTNQTMSMSLNLVSVTEKPFYNLDTTDYCGVDLGDGKCCERQPVKGRKRCEQHKGMRVNGCRSKLSLKEKWIHSDLISIHG